MKLNYSPKRTITTADLYNTADPPLIFEILVRPPRPWVDLYNEFEKDGAQNLDQARELISLTFLTVSDGEGVYPLDTIEAVADLQAAIEENNPDCGVEFCCSIAWSFGRHYYSFLSKHLGNSLEPLPQSNGSSGAKNPAVVS